MLWLESSSFCKVHRELLACNSIALALARSSNALPVGKTHCQYRTVAAKDPKRRLCPRSGHPALGSSS